MSESIRQIAAAIAYGVIVTAGLAVTLHFLGQELSYPIVAALLAAGYGLGER